MKVGNQVFVSGCTASTPEGIVGIGDVYAQTVQTLKTVKQALELAGATLNDVVRTRIYLTNIADWEIAGRAHGEVFGEVRPASTLLGVSGFVSPDMLVEIEADAITGQ